MYRSFYSGHVMYARGESWMCSMQERLRKIGRLYSSLHRITSPWPINKDTRYTIGNTIGVGFLKLDLQLDRSSEKKRDPFRLLDLPPEMRDMIHSRAFLFPGVDICYSKWNNKIQLCAD